MKNRYRYPNQRSAPPRESYPSSSGGFKGFWNGTMLALIGGIFILGVGVGIGFSSTTSFHPESIDSSIEIDQQAPNPEFCVQYGASAIVSDMRMFVTLKPFNVFVTQPVTQPGCVVRQSNITILEQQKLVTSERVRDCKRRMNTLGFVGNLEGNPRFDCVYQNDAAGNLFLPDSERSRRESVNF
jgi:hypothetical protein